jgi:hypothetical protein
LPEGEVPAPKGSGLSKSATSRRFVALSAAWTYEALRTHPQESYQRGGFARGRGVC